MHTHLRRAAQAAHAQSIPGGDDLIDRHEAAGILRVSTRTLDRWHQLRIGPPRVNLPSGRTARYFRSSVIEYARQYEQTPVRGGAAA